MSPPCRRARRDLPPTLSPVHLGQTPPCRDREPTDRPRCLDRELGRPLAAPPSVGRRTPSTERGRPDARSLRTTPAGGVGAGVMERSGPGGHRPAQVLWPCCSFICAMFRTASAVEMSLASAEATISLHRMLRSSPWRSSGMPQPQLAHIGGLLPREMRLGCARFPGWCAVRTRAMAHRTPNGRRDTLSRTHGGSLWCRIPPSEAARGLGPLEGPPTGHLAARPPR